MADRGAAPRTLAACLLVAGFAVMLALNLPGQLSYDSVVQLADGRSGHYNSWHPAVMAWLLGLFDAILPGSALFVLFQAFLLAAAFALCLDRRAGWGAPLAALAVMATPQFLLFQGTVWKDVLFANATLAAFAALARAVQSGGRVRRGLLGFFFAALTLAILTRQNGAILLPVGALTFGLALGGPALRSARLALAACALLLALTLLGHLLLGLRGDGGDGLKNQIRLAQTYDLTGAARRGYALERLSRTDPSLAARIRTEGVRAYSVRMMDTLEPALGKAVQGAPDGVIAAQWRDLVLGRPDLYLKQRGPVFWQVLATPDVALCHPAFVGIEGEPALLKQTGLSARIRPQDLWLAGYTRGFMGTPMLSHLAFGAAALLLLAFHLRRRRPCDIAMAGLLGGALVFAASFFVVSVACDYRYLYLLDLSVLLAAFRLLAAARTTCGPA